MDTSRLFVKNLPPVLSDDEFRKHFSTGGRIITDVKLIPKRRIGYVGYKTPEEAAKALKYFNKSYIRMSKISVEPARPIEDVPSAVEVSLQRAHQNQPDADARRKPPSESLPTKRKHDEEEADPKLGAFLDAMRPGAALSRRDKVQAADVVMAVPDDQGGDDDGYEDLASRPPKKIKPEALPSVDTNTSELHNANVVTDDVQRQLAPMHADATDDDWLRGRTSRVLDLVEPEDRLGTQPPSTTTATQGESGDATDTDSPVQAHAHDEAVAASYHVPLDAAEQIRATSRLYLRNLSYQTSEEDLRGLFEVYGQLNEVQISTTTSGKSKGFATITFDDASAAIESFQALDGKTFQGRLLHILPAQAKKETGPDEFEISRMPHKKQNLVRKKVAAASSTFNWNTLYLNQDTVLTTTAERLGVTKSELLDPTSADAAVRQAVAETNVIQETKDYFATRGINLEAFKSQKRGDTAILVKNLAYSTSPEELRALFEEYGTVLQVLMPPSRVIAIVQYSQPSAARTAFAKLAYRRHKDSVLYLEKAPASIFAAEANEDEAAPKQRTAQPEKQSVVDLLETNVHDAAESSSLYVRNLNFDTTTDILAAEFRPLDGFLSAKVKTKSDPKNPSAVLSMGFGFVEFKSRAQAEAAAKVMDGAKLQAHKLAVKLSHKGVDAVEEKRREDKVKKAAAQKTKVVVKNLPFEASKSDLRRLLGTYGQLKVVRIPKKLGNSSRGFAFAEFATPGEAQNAINALKDTHLLGRRLILDYAEAEAIDAEEEIAQMLKKQAGQVNRVAIQQLTGQNRQKVNIGGDDNDNLEE